MNSKQKKTLELVFKNPVQANIMWADIEGLFIALGAELYKGYMGTVEYDAQAKIFHGDIINTRDVISFQGTTVSEIEQAFKDSINDYIAWCEEEGVEPEKPYSGKFNIRLSPELHRQIAVLAKKRRMSLNSFVEKAIINEITLLRSSSEGKPP